MWGHAGVYEREAEVRLLTDRIAALGGGGGGPVVVQGRSGSGRTTLLQAGAALAQEAGAQVAAVRAREHERHDEAATVRRLLAAVGADGPASHGTFAHVARTRPLVLAVDDLHLADAASIAVLHALAEDAHELAVLLLLSVRPARWPDAGSPLDDLRAFAGAAVLQPLALSADAVARVLQEHGIGAESGDVDVDGVTAWTGGVPALVRAVAQDGGAAGTVPGSVSSAVAGDLRRQPADEVAVLRALAVLGPSSPLRRIAQLTGLSRPRAEAAADGLARDGIATPGDPLSFRAPVEAAAVRASYEPFALARAHRNAAALLEGEGADAIVVADHLVHTSPDADARVVETLRAAARQALRAGRPEQASTYLQRALAEPAPEEEHDELVLELVDAEAFAGRPASVELLENALAKMGAGPPRARAARRLTELLFLRGAFEQGAATALRGLGHCGDDLALREALLGDFLAVASFAPSMRADFEARFREVMDDVARGGSMPQETGLLTQVTAAMAIGGAPRDQVMGLVDELLVRVPTLDGPPLGNFADWICVCCFHADELDRCGQVARRSSAMAQEQGNAVRQGLMSFWLGMVHLAQGRLHGAVAHLTAGLRRRDAGWALGVPHTAAALCTAEVERGRLPEAVRALAAAQGAEPGGYHDGVLLEARGRVALAAGRAAEALELFEASGRHLKESFFIDAPSWITWRSNAAFAIRAMDGDLARALDLAQEELAMARTMGGARQVARAMRAVAASLPGTDEAVQVLEDARAVIDAAPERLERPHVLSDLGEARLAVGDLDGGKDVLLEALELATLCDAGALEARVRSVLRRAGVRPRRFALTGARALTPAEARVAELAASGLQNRQIAHALTVSERTVESHLYSVFRKLGISRRNDLAHHVDVAAEDG